MKAPRILSLPFVSLFDLARDRGENHDLANEKPELAAMMQSRLHARRASVAAREMTVASSAAAKPPRP